MVRYIYFDVGNTLTFADHSRTLAPLDEAGFRPAAEQLYAAERAAKRHLDAARQGQDPQPGRVDQDFWVVYYQNLVQQLSAPDTLVAPLVAATRRSEHWNQVQPGTREVLAELHRMGKRLGVISNSDGRIAQLLETIGLGDCFDGVTDSGHVGFEKPHPGIFRAALASLQAQAEESLYVGDIYSVDYLGATAAGMRAILMDVAGTYRDNGLPRIESLTELVGLI